MFTQKTFTVLLAAILLAGPSYAAIEAPDFPQMIQQGEQLAQQKQWDNSELIYLKAADSPIPDIRAQAYEGLTKLYKKIHFQKKAARAEKRLAAEKEFIAKLVPEDDSYYHSYEVKQGETYAVIAAREKISLEWLLRANHRETLRAGKTIRVPNDHYTLIVSKKDRVLTWMRGDEILKRYPVAIGKKGTETPDGEFTVVSRVKNPIWYHLNVQIPPDSPKNLLGPRWLGLDVKGYGIHGTRHPKTIQYAASHGCVRMFNRDVEELFEWIPIGTKVSIK